MSSRRPTERGLLATALVLAMAHPTTAFADATNTAGLWTLANLRAPVSTRWALNLETDVRLLDNFKTTSELIIQPGVLFTINPTWTTSLQYTYDAKPTSNNENRVMVDATYHDQVGAVVLGTRFRVTPRFIQNVGTVLRIRYKLAAIWAIASTESYLIGWNELFFNANDQGAGPAHGFGQNRLYAGVGYHFGAHQRAEIGYMWRYERLRAPTNASDHIIAVSFFFDTKSKAAPRKPVPHEVALPVSR